MGLSVSGLGSGIDWQSILEQLREVENKRITLLTTDKTNQEKKLSAWKDLAAQLTAVQSAAADFKTASSFKLFTTSLSSSSSVDPNSLLSVTASSSAAKGSYQVVINNLARAERLASGPFSSQTAAVGASAAGVILINGRAVTINATDTLQDVRTAINAVNSGTNASGVAASIMQDSSGNFQLVLTSEHEGAAGISLQNGSASDTLGGLGFNAAGTAIKNQVTGAAQSDRFTSSTTAVEALLGIEAQNVSGTVTINGKSVALDLSSTLEVIRDALNAAGLSARIVTQTEGSTTYSRLEVEGMTSWTDSGNVLQALGLIEGTRGDVTGTTSGVANTSDGSTPITAATLISDIYGYVSHSAGDKITISGTGHDGSTVAATDFTISDTTTVGDLLAAIQAQFANVTASITPDGRIQVIDNATGTSKLSVSLATTLTAPDAGSLDFGAFTPVGAVRKYVLQQGEDASFTVDGVSMTSSTNTVTSAVAGLTLNLLGEDPGTTVTVNVDKDVKGIEDKVKKLVDAYNSLIGFIDAQMKYNPDTKAPGGPLFGDNIMKSIKMDLQTYLLAPSGQGGITYLTDMGFKIGSDNKLTFDSDTFEAKLKTNFDDVVRFFTDAGSCTDSDFEYVYSSYKTKPGTYAVEITQAPSPGVDIAGTIDGRPATGHGNVLTLNDSSSSANGLSIRYTGTIPATASFTFARGLASMIDWDMSEITDSIDGSVTTQQNGIQSNIDALAKKITTTQDQIDQKMAIYQRQFEAMDSAVAQMQSLMNYMSTQLASLSSG